MSASSFFFSFSFFFFFCSLLVWFSAADWDARIELKVLGQTQNKLFNANSSRVNNSFKGFSTLPRVVPKLKQKRFPFLYSMGTNTVPILTLCLLCGILHGIMCTSFKERQFLKKTGVLYQSPYSGPEVTSCWGRPCTTFSCAMTCQKEAGCVIFKKVNANSDSAHLYLAIQWNTLNAVEWNTLDATQ